MRALRRALVAWVLVVLALTGAVPARAAAAPATQAGPLDEVIAIVVDGVGNGHGRGLSQWGAYGWAVTYGQSWTQILDHYYGGTVAGTVAAGTRIRVRLLARDGAAQLAVVSTPGTALWGGGSYGALQAVEIAPNRYDVFASTTPACPGTGTWAPVSTNVAGPIVFTTSTAEATAAAGDVLGLCQPDGSVTHYRGRLELVKDNAGNARVVNDVAVESYLRGVVSREVSTSWGDAGGGAGINALRAQSVAARSYALAQNRYVSAGGYAQTCDTTQCQVYGGAARRISPTSPISSGGVCEGGNLTFECRNTDRAIADTARAIRRTSGGAVVSTEFAASNGPRTAGGAFPAVDDPADDVPANPSHRWTQVLDAHQVAATWGLGPLSAASTEPDPATPYDGIWDNRVRLVGANGTMLVGSAELRTAFGLRSSGFTVRAITRATVTSQTFALVGDSVGQSVTETATSELPALLDGVFGATRFDAVQNRCTAGCSLSGVAAAAEVPLGTGLVLVELGYNDSTTDFGARIDEMMRALVARQVGRVVWVNLTQRSGRPSYASANQALLTARSRWPQLAVIDWNAHSAGNASNQNRWFAVDGIHLTPTGQSEFGLFLRAQVLPLVPVVGAADDVLLRYWTGSAWIWDVGRSTGSGFVAAGNWYWGRGGTAEPVYVGDFSGDGRDDVLLRYAFGSSVVWDVARSTGSGFVPMGNWYWGRGGTAEPVYVGDFTGDGRDDVLLRYWTGSAWIWDVGRSTGTGFVAAGNWYWGRGGTPEPVYVGDYTGDGRDDVLLRYAFGSSVVWDVARSTGSGFVPAGNWYWGRGRTAEPVYTGDLT